MYFFRNLIFTFFALIFSLSCLAGPDVNINQESFSYILPGEWEMFKQNEDSGFKHYAFYNEQTDIMIELSVSEWLDSSKFQVVKQAFTNDIGKDKPQLKMKAVSHRVVEIIPYGKVDEDIYQSTKGDYKHISYNLYNKSHIALITFTLQKNKPNMIDTIRPLLLGFKWKEVINSVHP